MADSKGSQGGSDNKSSGGKSDDNKASDKSSSSKSDDSKSAGNKSSGGKSDDSKSSGGNPTFHSPVCRVRGLGSAARLTFLGAGASWEARGLAENLEPRWPQRETTKTAAFFSPLHLHRDGLGTYDPMPG